jgi:hypothetical protein
MPGWIPRDPQRDPQDPREMPGWIPRDPQRDPRMDPRIEAQVGAASSCGGCLAAMPNGQGSGDGASPVHTSDSEATWGRKVRWRLVARWVLRRWRRFAARQVTRRTVRAAFQRRLAAPARLIAEFTAPASSAGGAGGGGGGGGGDDEEPDAEEEPTAVEGCNCL